VLVCATDFKDICDNNTANKIFTTLEFTFELELVKKIQNTPKKRVRRYLSLESAINAIEDRLEKRKDEDLQYHFIWESMLKILKDLQYAKQEEE
jgi:transcriptional regulator NrdR family protein